MTAIAVPCTMGIDIGTFETKGVLLDRNGKIAATWAEKHGMENPKPGHYEHDAEEVWWKDFCNVSRGLLRKSGLTGKDVACVAASALGVDCLPVDENCRPLRKAILYGIDARSQKEIDFLTEYYGPGKVKELFGRALCSDDAATKILWIKNNEPEVYDRTFKFLTGSSYITAKLTGNYVIDQFLAKAAFRPLYREDGTVNEELCGLYCRPDQLASCLTVTDIAGTVTEAAAGETGLAPGTPVTTGTGDSTAEAISTGVLQAGDMMLQFGSSLFIYCCTDRLIQDERVRGGNFTIPGTYSVAAGTNTAGTLTKWYRDNLFPELLTDSRREPFQAMLDGVDQVPPGSDGLITLPYFAGERTPINDPLSKGMIFGLRLTHTRAHLYRSALEGVGYAVSQHVDILKELGVPLERIWAVGGGTKNPLWMQMVADITGEPIRIPEVTMGASYGDALMAAIGVGWFSGFADLAQVIRPARVLEPDPRAHEVYRELRPVYDELYRRNKDLMHQL